MNSYLIVSCLLLIIVQMSLSTDSSSPTVRHVGDIETADVNSKNSNNFHQKFERLRRSEPASTNTKFCEIEVQEIRKLKGKCIRLFGGRGACTAGDWMDPLSPDCEDL